MKNKNLGISLIVLIITILVITILAAVVIPSGIDKINSAKLASFNTDILTVNQEVNSYMALNNLEYPAKTDVSGNKIIYSINDNPALMVQADKKGDQDDIFYIVDLEKLKMSNVDNGEGATKDDYYIVAKTSRNIYYAKGVTIGNITYYTKGNKGDGVVAVLPTSAATLAATPTATPTATPIPEATSAPVSGGMDTPTPTLTSTPTPTLTSTPTPTPTNTPATSPTNTPAPTSTPTPSTAVLTLQNVAAIWTLNYDQINISGQVKGNSMNSTIYIYCSYYDVDYGSPFNPQTDLITTLNCNTLWQDFNGYTGILDGGNYSLTVWAEDASGNKSNMVDILVS